MIKSVINISRAQFKRINFYHTSFNPTKKTHAYISIYGTEYDEIPAPRVNHAIWMDGIQLQFDDIEKDIKGLNLKKISKEQANQIVQFIIKLHNLPEEIFLVIHCYAGISRSAGIGKFTNDILKLNLSNYENLDIFNSFVYSMLKDSWECYSNRNVM